MSNIGFCINGILPDPWKLISQFNLSTDNLINAITLIDVYVKESAIIVTQGHVSNVNMFNKYTGEANLNTFFVPDPSKISNLYLLNEVSIDKFLMLLLIDVKSAIKPYVRNLHKTHLRVQVIDRGSINKIFDPSITTPRKNSYFPYNYIHLGLIKEKIK